MNPIGVFIAHNVFEQLYFKAKHKEDTFAYVYV